MISPRWIERVDSIRSCLLPDARPPGPSGPFASNTTNPSIRIPFPLESPRPWQILRNLRLTFNAST